MIGPSLQRAGNCFLPGLERETTPGGEISFETVKYGLPSGLSRFGAGAGGSEYSGVGYYMGTVSGAPAKLMGRREDQNVRLRTKKEAAI
jgi:hypothetical protein